MTTLEYADSLRQLADWYEAHPEIPVPSAYELSVDIHPDDTPESVTRLARALAPCEKDVGGADQELFILRRRFGAMTLEAIFWRSAVCTRRVIGTVQVPAHVIPAHTKELVEWDCPESVLSHDPA